MNGQTNQDQRMSRNSRPRLVRRSAARRPFWLPTLSYYILAGLVSAVFFGFTWMLLREGGEETPSLLAAVGAGLVLLGAVVVREIFLRKTRERFLLVERKLDNTLKSLPPNAQRKPRGEKISLETNHEIVKTIQKKSQAAQILGGLPDGHLEVLETCNEYLNLVNGQIATIGIGSPRLSGLRRGQEIVAELHHFHLLTWAELESRAWSQKARNYVKISDKLAAAQQALNVLETALQFYPSEPQLTESMRAIRTFITSIKVTHQIELAERAAFKGNYKRGISLYKDALFFLAREHGDEGDKNAAAEKINAEIEKLRDLSERGKSEVKLRRGENREGNEYSKVSEM